MAKESNGSDPVSGGDPPTSPGGGPNPHPVADLPAPIGPTTTPTEYTVIVSAADQTRDDFAKAVVQAIIGSDSRMQEMIVKASQEETTVRAAVASYAYEVADAMMSARSTD